MNAPEIEIIIDPWANTAPMSMEDKVNDHVAIRIGRWAAAGATFRRATAEEVAAHRDNYPEAHEKLRASVLQNLAIQSGVPAEYQPLQVIADTAAA